MENKKNKMTDMMAERFMRKFIIMAMVIMAGALTSCSGGDDEKNLKPDSYNIAGEWVCYEQEWYEDGEYDQESYGDDGGSLILSEDGTGQLKIKNSSILEIGMSAGFLWKISDGCLITNIHDYTLWEIQSLSKRDLVLVMDDDDLVIKAHFKRVGTQEDAPEETLTKEILEGRWFITSYYDPTWNDHPIDFTITDEEYTNGTFPWYIDFNKDGTGAKNVSRYDLVLGSTTYMPFTWTFSRNKINILSYESRYTWTVRSYRGGVLTLYVGDDTYATMVKYKD